MHPFHSEYSFVIQLFTVPLNTEWVWKPGMSFCSSFLLGRRTDDFVARRWGEQVEYSNRSEHVIESHKSVCMFGKSHINYTLRMKRITKRGRSKETPARSVVACSSGLLFASFPHFQLYRRYGQKMQNISWEKVNKKYIFSISDFTGAGEFSWLQWCTNAGRWTWELRQVQDISFIHSFSALSVKDTTCWCLDSQSYFASWLERVLSS